MYVLSVYISLCGCVYVCKKINSKIFTDTPEKTRRDTKRPACREPRRIGSRFRAFLCLFVAILGLPPGRMLLFLLLQRTRSPEVLTAENAKSSKNNQQALGRRQYSFSFSFSYSFSTPNPAEPEPK